MKKSEQSKANAIANKRQGFRRFFSICIKCLLMVVVFIFLLLAILPSLLSISSINQALISAINHKIPGKFALQDLHLSWVGAQHIQALTLKDAQGEEIALLREAKVNASLFRIIFAPRSIDDAKILLTNVKIEKDLLNNGATNIEKALNINCCDTKNNSSNVPKVKIIIDDIEAIYQKGANEFPLRFKANGTTSQKTSPKGEISKGEIGTFKIEAFIGQLLSSRLFTGSLNLKEILQVKNEQFKVNADIANFPIALLKSTIFFENSAQQKVLQELLGKKLNINIQRASSVNSLLFKLSSETFSSTAELIIDSNMVLSFTQDSHLTLTPALFNRIKDTLQIDNPISLASPTQFNVFCHCDYPLNINQIKEGFPFQLKALLQFEGATFINHPQLKKFSIQKISASFNTHANEKGGKFLMQAFARQDGRPFTIELESPFKILNSIDETIKAFKKTLNVKLSVSGAPIDLIDDVTKMGGKLKEEFGNTADLAITLNNGGQKIYGTMDWNSEGLTLNPLSFTIDHWRLQGNLGAKDHLQSSGTLTASHIKAKNSAPSLEHLNIDWDVDTKQALLNIHLSTDVKIDTLALGKIKAIFKLSDWKDNNGINFNRLKVQTYAKLHHFPSQMLNIFLNRQDLLPLIGDAIDLTASMQYSMQNNRGDLNCDIASTNVNGSISFIYSDAILALLKEPKSSHLKWQLTPEGYKVLRKLKADVAYEKINLNEEFNLLEPALFIATFNDLSLPISSSTFKASFEKAVFDVSLNCENLSGMSLSTSQKIFFKEIKTHIASKNLKNTITFTTEGKGSTGDGIPTEWQMSGSFQNAFTEDLKLNQKDIIASVDGTLKTLPIGPICQLGCVYPQTRHQIEAIIGPSVDAGFKAKLSQQNGMLYLDLKGKNAHLLIDGTLNNGIFSLNQDLLAKLIVTPELSDYVLEGIIPIFDGMISADDPLSMHISAQGFSLSLDNPTLAKLTISKAELNLKKIRFSPQSELAKVLSLLVNSSKDPIVVATTPIYLSIKEGIVEIKRVDLLINDRFPIAAWGNVNLNDDDVDMIIGVAGASIAQAFKVSNIPNRYMLQIPFKGTLKRVAIDKTKAAARLSALVAQAQGGPQGLVLGTFLHIASGGLNEKEPPPPSTTDLPWKTLLEDKQRQEDAAEEIAKDVGGETTKDTVHQLKKGASDLFKKLLH